MQTLLKNKRDYQMILIRVIEYGLPFIYFYAIGDLIEELKKPASLYQDSVFIKQWLYHNNQDNLMQYLILGILLATWGIIYYVLQRSFTMRAIRSK